MGGSDVQLSGASMIGTYLELSETKGITVGNVQMTNGFVYADLLQ